MMSPGMLGCQNDSASRMFQAASSVSSYIGVHTSFVRFQTSLAPRRTPNSRALIMRTSTQRTSLIYRNGHPKEPVAAAQSPLQTQLARWNVVSQAKRLHAIPVGSYYDDIPLCKGTQCYSGYGSPTPKGYAQKRV